MNGTATSLINLASLGLELEEHPAARKALYDLSALPGVASYDFARAAEIQMILGDLASASDSLTQAIKLSNPANSQWQFELACLQKSMGDSAAAQETIRQTISGDPLSPENWLLQADLFGEQGRHQSAIESLEKALSLMNTKSQSNSIKGEGSDNPVFANYVNISIAEIHSRFSRLMYQIGNLTGALVHAEQALEIEPQNLNLRLQAARMAESLLLTDRAQSLAEIPSEQEQILNMEENPSDDSEVAAELIAMKAARLISDQKLSEAEALSGQIRRLSPTGFHKENIEILLSASKGDNIEVQSSIDSHVVQHLLENRKSKPSILLSGISIAAMDAALAVERWDLALKLAEQIVASHPLEPAAHLAFARALVRSAEEFLLRKELGIQKHIPSDDIFSQTNLDKFEAEIVAAGKQSNSPDVAIWQKRGLLVFGGKSALEKIEITDFTKSCDQAAYLQALRLAGHSTEVIEFGEKCEETPEILLQMALSLHR